MKTILKLVAVVTGVISMISAIWLACLYVDDILKYITAVKIKLTKLATKKK